MLPNQGGGKEGRAGRQGLGDTEGTSSCVVVMQKQTTGLEGHPRLLAELLLLTDYIT